MGYKVESTLSFDLKLSFISGLPARQRDKNIILLQSLAQNSIFKILLIFTSMLI